jgi:hypothetical protein
VYECEREWWSAEEVGRLQQTREKCAAHLVFSSFSPLRASLLPLAIPSCPARVGPQTPTPPSWTRCARLGTSVWAVKFFPSGRGFPVLEQSPTARCSPRAAALSPSLPPNAIQQLEADADRFMALLTSTGKGEEGTFV